MAQSMLNCITAREEMNMDSNSLLSLGGEQPRSVQEILTATMALLLRWMSVQDN